MKYNLGLKHRNYYLELHMIIRNTPDSTSTTTAAASRRKFLQTSAASLAAISIMPGHVLGLNGVAPPSEKLTLAFIGVGGRGKTNLDELAKSCNVLALCDLDDRRAADVLMRYESARRYRVSGKCWMRWKRA